MNCLKVLTDLSISKLEVETNKIAKQTLTLLTYFKNLSSLIDASISQNIQRLVQLSMAS